MLWNRFEKQRKLLQKFTVITNDSLRQPREILRSIPDKVKSSISQFHENTTHRKLNTDFVICYRYGGSHTLLEINDMSRITGISTLDIMTNIFLSLLPFCREMSKKGLVNLDLHAGNIILSYDKASKKLHPVIIDFEEIVEQNEVNMRMIQRITQRYPDYRTLLQQLHSNELYLIQALEEVGTEHNIRHLLQTLKQRVGI